MTVPTLNGMFLHCTGHVQNIVIIYSGIAHSFALIRIIPTGGRAGARRVPDRVVVVHRRLAVRSRLLLYASQ